MKAKKLGVVFGLYGLCCLGVLGCSDRKEVVPVQAGIMVPQSGIVIDVDYDPRLDTLIPGYKLVTVAIDNNSLNPFHLDPKKDKWQVQDSRGHWFKAIHNMKESRKNLWRQLPSRVRQMIEYPDAVGVGETGVFDLFVKSSVLVEGFRGVRYEPAEFGRIIEIQREP